MATPNSRAIGPTQGGLGGLRPQLPVYLQDEEPKGCSHDTSWRRPEYSQGDWTAYRPAMESNALDSLGHEQLGTDTLVGEKLELDVELERGGATLRPHQQETSTVLQVRFQGQCGQRRTGRRACC